MSSEVEVEQIDGNEQAIYGTDVVGDAFYGSIKLTFADGSSCSGVLLNNHVLLTAAHCLQPANTARDYLPLFGNGVQTVTIRYDAPNGDGFVSLSRTLFFYTHEKYTGVLEDHPNFDVAVAGTKDSFGLSSAHFAMLRTERPPVGAILGMSGYGVGNSGLPNPNDDPAWLHVRIDSQANNFIGWTSVSGPEGACSGDSGSMLGTASNNFFPDTATQGHETIWWAVSHLQSTVTKQNELPGTPPLVTCNNSGSAVDLLDFHDTIKDVVDFWGPNTNPGGQIKASETHKCTLATNGVDNALYCWDTK
ncbi:MAG: trypsin-like serine protease [Myxococcales bacterium]|nr:trypsin-like serine protease [Myxococcales bacterium]